ncbi:MAG: hypothetical protein ACXVZX_09375 [Terriglobales bacterium]
MAIARTDGAQQLDKLSASLGQISYGMSSYHMRANPIVLGLLGRHSLWFHVPVVIAVTALLGACSFHVVERRFLRLKTRFSGSASNKPPASVAAEYELVHG